jgi:hypothetical protein
MHTGSAAPDETQYIPWQPLGAEELRALARVAALEEAQAIAAGRPFDGLRDRRNRILDALSAAERAA